VDAFTFLAKVGKSAPQPVYVLTGDEALLKQGARSALASRLLGEADPDLAWTSLPGDEAEWAAVRSELETLPFLSDRRVVYVEAADAFVTANRSALEKYVSQPSKSGVLVLDVKSWPSNTKLAKALPDAATIECKPPSAQRLPGWCVERMQSRHGKKLSPEAAAWLVELAGPELSQLDQELTKLAIYVGSAASVDHDDVDRVVGRSRAAETFKIFDAIAAGQPAAAVGILRRLFDEGVDPLMILGAFSWQLRQLAQVGGETMRGQPLASAMAAAGVAPFARARTEQLLRHLGRRRIARLYDWLIEADLSMKGGGQLPDRILLERLLVRLARPREP
jgi:DNA polymerase-3 subunit delta